VYSTQKSVVLYEPDINANQSCGKYLQLPIDNYPRYAEGGLRLDGKFKQKDKEKPLISIITVVFNRIAKVERAIKSVLNQSYDNIEYIIVDGGSSDSTLDIIKKYEFGIDYYVSEKDKGIYNAMNKGLSLATGDFIGILNSDDWYAENIIAEAVNTLLINKADYSYGEAIVVDEDGTPIGEHASKFVDGSAFFELSPCNHGTMFISHDAYEQIGYYDEKYKIAADFKMQLRLIDHDFKGCKVANPVYYYEIAGASATQQAVSIDNMCDILLEYHTGLSKKDVLAFVELRWKDKFDCEQFCEIVEKLIPELHNTKIKKQYLIQWLLKNFIDKREVISSEKRINQKMTWRRMIKMILPYGFVHYYKRKRIGL